MLRTTLVQTYRRWRLRMQGLAVERSCRLGRDVSLGSSGWSRATGAVSVGRDSELGNGVELNPWGGRIAVGHHVFIGPYTVLYGHGGIDIGAHTLISMHCRILSSNHTIPSADRLIRDQPDRLLPTRIGRDVWLGAGVTVLGGVTIGDGCVVGAGSVVTTDLPPYSVAVGVPARLTRPREDRPEVLR